ncbi:MAG: ABC transporter ATP-binding protein [Microscillaceae bacterium]|nr:ABC transporter ATP-binding protein [Microscillaceae bacterium]
MSKAVIQVEQISKKYTLSSTQQFQKSQKEDFWALKDVSFQVNQGEIIGVIGKNGSGKSTLLKILSRITRPTSGRITIEGQMAALLEVGTGFHPELSGRENIFLNGILLGMKRAQIREKLDEIIDFADIDTYLDVPVKYYSSGMFVRLAFSVAAHLETNILLLDEVLSVGDANFQNKCLDKIDQIHGSKTVIFVSHHLPSIIRLTHRTLHLHEGKIIKIGDSRTVSSQYIESHLHLQAQFNSPNPHTAPGNEFVRLLSVKVHNQNFVPGNYFRIDQPLGITMEYQVLESGKLIYPAYNFYNENGINLFDSHDFNSTWKDTPKEKGIYQSTVWIPAHLLNIGYMVVGAAILSPSPFKIHLHLKEIIGFNLIDPPSKDVEDNFNAKIPGIIRPKLTWSLSRLG